MTLVTLAKMALPRLRLTGAGWLALVALALLLAAPGCQTDAQDRDYSFNNPLDPNQDTGDGNGDNTGQLVIAYVDAANDVVVITNTGTEDTDMSNWTLENENDTASYTFSITLASGAFVRVFSATGTDTSTDLYTGSTNPNWGSTFPNAQAILRNNSGDAIDICEDGETCWQ